MIARRTEHEKRAMLDRLQRQVITGEIGMDEWTATVMSLLEKASARGGDAVLSDWLWPALRELLNLARAWEPAAATLH